MPLGIPYSEFKEWHEPDQDKALEWLRFTNRSCSTCGTVTDDWLDEDGIPHEDPPYLLDSKKCLGCAIMAEEQESLSKSKEKGVFLFFRRVKEGFLRRE